MSSGTTMTREATAQAWRDFCAKLAEAGDVLLRSEVPETTLNQAEGLRYLTQLLRAGLVQNLEAANPDFPFFFQPCDEITKFGADNPDNVYLLAGVKGDRDYRITGTRGTVSYFSIVSNALRPSGAATTGELNDATMTWGPKGSFEIIASSKKQAGNWLRMESDSNMILVRQTRLDHAKEQAGTYHIEALDVAGAPAPLDPQGVVAALMRTVGFIRGSANRYVDWLPHFQNSINLMPDIGQEFFQKQGGDPSIKMTWGYFRLAPDEAWVVDFSVSATASYWSFVLYTCWAQSLDYRYRPVFVNKHTAKRNADGSLTVIASANDPGMGNWCDTGGHSEAMTLFRGIGLVNVPEFKCRVVKIADLKP